MEKPVLTVSELNERIKNLIESDPMLGEVCVRGELSNYKIYPSGHHYFTLKDSESSLRWRHVQKQRFEAALPSGERHGRHGVRPHRRIPA